MRYSAFVMGRNSLMTRCLIEMKKNEEVKNKAEPKKKLRAGLTAHVIRYGTTAKKPMANGFPRFLKCSRKVAKSA